MSMKRRCAISRRSSCFCSPDIKPVCGKNNSIFWTAGPVERKDSTHVITAIHVQRMTSDIARHWRREKERDVNNLTRVAQPTKRNLFNEILRYFFGHTFAHADIDESGGNGINGYLLTSELSRADSGQGDDGGFARGIIGLPEQSHLSADGREVDNPTAISQHRCCLLRNKERAGKIHTDHALELIQCYFFDRPIADNSRVIEENVETTTFITNFHHHRLDLLGISDIALNDERIGQGPRDVLRICLILSLRIINVVDDALRSALVKGANHLCPDPARTARNKDHFAGEIEKIGHD